MLNSIRAIGFVHYIETVRSSEGPLWEVPLYKPTWDNADLTWRLASLIIRAIQSTKQAKTHGIYNLTRNSQLTAFERQLASYICVLRVDTTLHLVMSASPECYMYA